MRGTSATAAGTRPDSSQLARQRTPVGAGVAIALAISATLAIAFVLARLMAGDLDVVVRALV